MSSTHGVATAEAAAASSADRSPVDRWPIAAALLQFPGTDDAGRQVNDAGPDVWLDVLGQVRAAGFDHVDLFDSWLRAGDLTADRRDELAAVLGSLGLAVPAISVARKSIIDPDPEVAAANLAYAHRAIDAAADLGASIVCLGLHRPLTPEQREVLWFWTVPGARDPLDDADVRRLCVSRFRELGRHAQEAGVEISIEMYEDTFAGTADLAVRLVEDIGEPAVGLNPDIGNLVRAHGPIESWESILRRTLPFTNYWHVKNYYRAEHPAAGVVLTTPAPMESGYIDYRRAVRLAIAGGFAGAFCVEHYGGDGLSVSASNRDYLRGLLRAEEAVGHEIPPRSPADRNTAKRGTA